MGTMVIRVPNALVETVDAFCKNRNINYFYANGDEVFFGKPSAVEYEIENERDAVLVRDFVQKAKETL